MRHQGIIFEPSVRNATYPKAPLQTTLPRKRRSRPGKKYPHTRNSEFVVPPHRRRRTRRRTNWKILLVLAPSLILSLFVFKWLSSFLTNSCQAFSEQFNNSSQQSVLPSPNATSPVAALSHAIISKESTQNFKSLNPHSQALGLAQIMPANLSEWSQDALGYPLTKDEFMNSPEAQRKIINHRLSEYWQDALNDSNGDEDRAVLKVASHWYSGNPDSYNSTAPQWYKGKDGKLHRYPSIAEYSNSVLKKYKQYIAIQNDS